MVRTQQYQSFKKHTGLMAVAITALAFSLLAASPVSAGHNGANVTHETFKCGETTFTAGIKDPQSAHKVGNMYLVVHDGDQTQSANIPTDGSTEEITVGPFTNDAVIEWRVFGGGERDYDNPLWNGYGDADFKSDVGDYGTANGWSWVTAGPSDSNPFTTWNEIAVEGCAEDEDGEVLGDTTEDEQVVAPAGAVDAGSGNGGSGLGVALGFLASSVVAAAGLTYRKWARLFNQA